MSQGCDTPKTQIPKLKLETIRNQNYPNPPKPKLIHIQPKFIETKVQAKE
jgi:hypothetical protein